MAGKKKKKKEPLQYGMRTGFRLPKNVDIQKAGKEYDRLLRKLGRDLSAEEFVEKAFHGDRHGKNFSRLVANKLLMDDLKKDKVDAEKKDVVTCTSCKSPTTTESGKCHVCGHELDDAVAEIKARRLFP